MYCILPFLNYVLKLMQKYRDVHSSYEMLTITTIVIYKALNLNQI